MDRSKATSPSTLKRTEPLRRIVNGFDCVECRICKARFKSLMPLSQHVVSVHQLTLSLKTKRKEKRSLHDSGSKAQHEDAVEVHDEDDEDDEDDDDDDDDDDEDDDEGDDDEVEGNEIWFTNENLALNCQLNAKGALEFLNDQVGGKRYQLVEHGPTMATNPLIEHVNFKAREKDCPDAADETFFAQLSSIRGMIDCCVSLGPSYKLPHWRNADLGGCKLCRGMIHHPVVKVDKLRLE